jgi:hypothetical protein
VIILQFNGREILNDAGKISKKMAEKLALQEYEKFNEKLLSQNKIDGFEKFIEENRILRKK